jgi:thioredoxin 1
MFLFLRNVFLEHRETLAGKGFQAIQKKQKTGWHAVGLLILCQTLKKKSKAMTKEITKTNFRNEVIDSMTLALVHFKKEWSGACQIISPVYEELARSYKGQARFFSVDVEKETSLPEEYGIIEIPTILFFKTGQVVDHVKGLAPKNVLISKIENALAARQN